MVTVSQTFRIYEVINRYFKNDDDSKSMVQGIVEIVDEKIQLEKQSLATNADMLLVKSDISELKADVSMLKTDVSMLKTDVSMLKTDVSMLKTDISKVRTDLSLQMEQGFNNMLKWIIVLMLGFSTLIVGSIKLFHQ